MTPRPSRPSRRHPGTANSDQTPSLSAYAEALAAADERLGSEPRAADIAAACVLLQPFALAGYSLRRSDSRTCLELRLVPRSAQLMDRLLATQPPSSAVGDLAAALLAAASVVRHAADSSDGLAARAPGDGDALTLFEQLTAVDVFRALSGAARFVGDAVWPLAVELAAVEPAAAGPEPQVHLRSAAGFRDLGGHLLGTVANVLSYVLRQAEGAGGVRRVLPALQQSGLVQGLCGAVLGAPPEEQRGRATAALSPHQQPSAYAVAMAVCQLETVTNVLSSLRDDVVARGRAAAPALRLLTSPEALALRREVLRQVALSGEAAPDSACETQGPDAAAAVPGAVPLGSSASIPGPPADSGDGSGGCGGSGGGPGAAPVPGQGATFVLPLAEPRWPLLRPAVLHGHPAFAPHRGELARLLFMLLGSAIAPVYDAGNISAGASRKGADTAAASQAAEQLFPSRGEAAELAARVAGALRRHMGGQAELLEGLSTPLRDVLELRMRGCSTEEFHACLPALLELHAHCLALTAAAGESLERPCAVPAAAAALAARLQNYPAKPSRPPNLPTVGTADWRMADLPAPVLAACVKRVLHTDLLASLDRLVRRLAAEGGAEANAAAAIIVRAAVGGLLGPLLCARLLWWRGRVLERARADSRVQRGQAPAGPEGAAGAGGGSETGAEAEAEVALEPLEDEDEDLPSVQGELGLLVTLAKLMRAEEARRNAGQRPSGGPELTASEANWYALALTSCLITCMPAGALPEALPQLVLPPEREEGVTPEAWAAAEWRLDAGRLAVWEAMCMCGSQALQLTALQLEAAADHFRTLSGPARERMLTSERAIGGHTRLQLAGERAACISSCIAQTCATFLLPDALRAAAPQRTLVALGRVAFELVRHVDTSAASGGMGAGSIGEKMRASVQKMLLEMGSAIIALSANQRLQTACVPGWLWATASRRHLWAPAGGPKESDLHFELQALIAIQDPAAPAPPRPVLLMFDSGATGRAMDRAGWASHARHSGAVAAMALKWTDSGHAATLPSGWGPWHVLQESAAAVRSRREGDGQQLGGVQQAGGQKAAEGGRAAWAPWLLRVCGNPRCDVWGEGPEADLPLKRCGGCRTVRYCGRVCQQAHWRGGHKEECGVLAAAAARKAKE
ncbi:hypothetical protein HYH03_008693 [Edaphochlamys debaryana]|uniref:MYND-type domain-containing protein n=1 Tax=Edaphochlamys debaryana TaxID=47281 RepID=A0A836BXY5_9CHLO|nr:hypothetical protein HYH03_008693 [Edaphochlamys debaryana]|eukprot:KAG2493030.1 hypothetical protein HYH03_008693 [Edaphochlamys debaryana]